MTSKHSAARVDEILTEWGRETTLSDVVHFCYRIHSDAMIDLVTGCREKDATKMLKATRKMRHIAARCDMFRRARVRQWALDDAAHPTESSVTK